MTDQDKAAMSHELIEKLRELGVRYEVEPLDALEVLANVVAGGVMYWRRDSVWALEVFARLLGERFVYLRSMREREWTDAIH